MQPQTTTASEHAIAVKAASRHLRPVVLEMRRRLDLLADRLPDLKARMPSRDFWAMADGIAVPLYEFVRRYQGLLARMRRPRGLTAKQLATEAAWMRGRLGLLLVGFDVWRPALNELGLTWG